jgi:hypothetical protein
MGTLASSGPVQKTAYGLGKRKDVFHFRTGYGGWMFAWKNHGCSLGRIDGWWSDLLPEW